MAFGTIHFSASVKIALSAIKSVSFNHVIDSQSPIKKPRATGGMQRRQILVECSLLGRCRLDSQLDYGDAEDQGSPTHRPASHPTERLLGMSEQSTPSPEQCSRSLAKSTHSYAHSPPLGVLMELLSALD
jgi:hypothetical protein